MNNTLNRRLKNLESQYHQSTEISYAHFSDEELDAEIERLDEIIVIDLIENGPSNDPDCLDLERKTAELEGQTVEEYRADLIIRYHQRHIDKTTKDQ